MTDIKCPFSMEFGDIMHCPYLEVDGLCKEIEVNVGNGDAWCSASIQDSFASREREKQMTVNFRWLLEKVDELHVLLCPDRIGTWQQRVDQVVKKIKEK